MYMWQKQHQRVWWGWWEFQDSLCTILKAIYRYHNLFPTLNPKTIRVWVWAYLCIPEAWRLLRLLEVQMEVQKKLYEQIEVTFTNYDQYSFLSRFQATNKDMLISLKHDFRFREREVQILILMVDVLIN